MEDGSQAEIVTTPEDVRQAWRLPDDTSYNKDPRTCFERTATQTTIEFIGSPQPHPETSFIFSTPIYSTEWKQGNLQKLLYEFLNRDYSDHVGAVELNFMLNEMRWDKSAGENWLEASKILARFEVESPTDKKDLYPDYDFSSMTHEEYLEFREQLYEKRIPYPNYLEPSERSTDIIQTNNEIISFFQDLIKIQTLGKRILESANNPTEYQSTLVDIGNIIEKYNGKADLKEILKLAYAKSDQVNISLLNLLNTDFLAEGYFEKNIPNVRCVGADYALERTRGLAQQDRIIFQMWDCDTIPSANFLDDLLTYYQNEDVDVANLPIGGLTSPGTSQDLFKTSINTMLGGWTSAGNYPTISTPTISFNLKVLRELNGITGDPPGAGTDEDRKTGWRLYRYMLYGHPEQYTKKVTMPPIATLMHDRPGWVDGRSRDTDKLEEGTEIDRAISSYLQDEDNHLYLSPDRLADYLNRLLLRRKITQDIEKKAAASGQELYKYLSKNENDRAIHRENWYSENELSNLEEIVGDPQQIKEVIGFHGQAIDAYQQIYFKQSQLNRLVVKELIRQKNTGNLHLENETNAYLDNADTVPSPLRFSLINYLQSNASFVKSLSPDDWSYAEYLIDPNKTCPVEKLTQTQQVLREYLGEPVKPQELIENASDYISSANRPANDRRSYLYATSILKLASSLTSSNFLQHMVDPNEVGKFTYGSGGLDNPVMADYEDRSKWVAQVTQKV